MNGSQPSAQQSPAQYFDTVITAYAEHLATRPPGEVAVLLMQTLDLRHRELRARACQHPGEMYACLAEASLVACVLVYVRRLSAGPTSCGHVDGLINALPATERDLLFRVREAGPGDVVTRDTFDRVCRHLQAHFRGEAEEQQRAAGEAVAQAHQIIDALYAQKAGPKKNVFRSLNLAIAKERAGKGVKYRVTLPTVNRVMAALGFTGFKDVAALKSEIAEEKKHNPRFGELMLLAEEFARTGSLMPAAAR